MRTWLGALGAAVLALALAGCNCGDDTHHDGGLGGGTGGGAGGGAGGGSGGGTGGGAVGGGAGGGGGGGAADAGCAMLDYAQANEPGVTLPLSTTYPAKGDATPSGQGSNHSHVGYTIDVRYIDGGTSTQFGVSDSDTGEGVPWDDAQGDLTDGNVKAWAIDVGSSATTDTITFTFDSPVQGLRFAITDLDFAQETIGVRAFASSAGGPPIQLTDNPLASVSAAPALALGMAHATNDAYVVDPTKVTAIGGGLYGVSSSGGVSDSTGTVLFVYGDAQDVQRVTLTYTGQSTGVWIAGMTYANLCGP